MAEEVVYAFFSRVAVDANLQKQLKELPGPSDDGIKVLLEIAWSQGYEFSADEYRSVLARVPVEEDDFTVRDADGIGVPYECTGATAWQGHPPTPHGCAVAWGCGVDHPVYGGPHIPLCSVRPV